MRIDGRALDELRSVKFTPDFTKFAEGSCLVEMGDTVVLCNASVDEKLPPHVQHGGWITAEYSMLPRANRERSKRDIAKLKLNGRSAENSSLLREMARSAIEMVTGSVDAFVKQDTALAEKVIAQDDVVDSYFEQVKEALIRKIADMPEDGAYALDLLMIAKYFERIGDHAVNLAQWVIFAVTGQHKEG